MDVSERYKLSFVIKRQDGLRFTRSLTCRPEDARIATVLMMAQAHKNGLGEVIEVEKFEDPDD